MKRRNRMLLTLLPGILYCGCSPAQWMGTWTGLPPMNLPRQEVGAAVIGDVLFVAGGLDDSVPLTSLDSVEAFDFTAHTWSFVAPMPVPLDHHMLVALDGMLYVIGGFSRPPGGPMSTVDTLYIYDPALDLWNAGTPMPQARGGAWAVAVGRKIYCVGGALGGTSFGDLFIYDVDFDTWSTGASMPTARDHLNVVTDGIDLYAIGGRFGSSFAVNERYIVAEDRWESLAPMPTARAAMGCAYLEGRIFCAGGETPQLHMVHEVYDIFSDTWSHLDPMPLPRHGMAAGVYDGAMVLAGGGIVQGLGPTNAVDMFTPPPKTLPAISWSTAVLAVMLFAGAASWRRIAGIAARRLATGAGAVFTRTG